MTVLSYIVRWVKRYVFHKSFFLGLCLSIGIFSPYIFGNDNLAEELAELFIYKETGVFLDFTPESSESVSNDFQEIIDLSGKFGGKH